MLDTAFDLRRTAHIVGAVPSRFAIFLHQTGAAFGAFRDELHLFAVVFAFFKVDAYDFRDYFAAFLNFYGVVVMQTELFDEIGIV